MIYNETINAARLAVLDAIKSVKSFDDDLTDKACVEIIRAVINTEGVPDLNGVWHDSKLYDKVRRKLRWGL